MLTIEELKAQGEDGLLALGYRKWDEKLMLIPLRRLNDILDGEKLTCIDGTVVTKGTDVIDHNTRFGLLAYGFNVS